MGIFPAFIGLSDGCMFDFEGSIIFIAPLTISPPIIRYSFL